MCMFCRLCYQLNFIPFSCLLYYRERLNLVNSQFEQECIKNVEGKRALDAREDLKRVAEEEIKLEKQKAKLEQEKREKLENLQAEQKKALEDLQKKEKELQVRPINN